MESEARRLTTEELLAHAGWVQALARRLVHDPATADDLVQETWLAALQQRWRGGGPSRAWLATVLRNAAHRRARGEANRGQRERRSAEAEALPSTGELIARVEQQRTLVEAVRALEDPYGRTVLLRYYEGLSSAEIARREDVPQATVRSRLKRALEQLRARLDETHEGGRETWVQALAPLAYLAERDAALAGASAASGVGAGALGGLWVKVATLALLFTGFLALRNALEGDELARPAAAPVAELDVRHAGDGQLVGDRDEPSVRSVVRDEVSGGSAAPSAAAVAAPRAGWWLVGQVHGVDAGNPSPIQVQVRASEGGFDVVKLERFVAPGPVELDLSELFQDEQVLCETLDVRFDHPERVGAQVRFSPTREERQAGFRAGGSACFPFDVTLEPARAVLRGTVRAPEGLGVHVGALHFDGDGDEYGSMLGTDGRKCSVACDADGRYVLCTDHVGRLRVIAYSYGSTRSARPVPRPAWIDVDVVPGEQEVEEIVLDDPGVALDGTLRFAGPAPPAPMHLALKRVGGSGPDESDLVWTGKRYTCRVRYSAVDGGGHFCFTGLEPGEYELRFEGFSAGSESLSALHGLAPRSARITVPSSGLTFDLGRYVFLEIRGGGQPLADAFVCLVSDPAAPDGSVAETGSPPLSSLRGSVRASASGRAVLALADASTGSQEVTIEKAGFRTLHLSPEDLRAGEWMQIELEPEPATASLVLAVDGDPERTAEQFRVFVRRLDTPAGGGDELDSEVKRVGDELHLRDMDAGRYALRVVPSRRGYPDFDSWILPETLEVDLLPGPNTAALPLRAGGRIRIDFSAVAEGWSGPFRVHDAGGNELTLEATRPVGESGLEVATGWLSHGSNPAPTELFPTLPPGAYELEIDVEGGAIERYPVVLEAGRSTAVRIR